MARFTLKTLGDNMIICEEKGCCQTVDIKLIPLFGKKLCFDCRDAYESIMDDMKHEQKMFEYFTNEEIMGLSR